MLTASSPTLVVTRPVQQSADFVRRAQVMGFDVQQFPLLEIQSLADQSVLKAIVERLDEFDMVAFVSPNAIDALFSHIEHWPVGTTIAVMGQGSRSALRKYGVTEQNANIISPSNLLKTDSETLLEELDFTRLEGRRVLIVRGDSGRELLADALRERGVLVENITAYKRTAPLFDNAKQQQLRLLSQQVAHWVITSSEALRNLLSWTNILSGDLGVAKMQRQHLIVPHARIAETAKNLGFQSITLTASGDEHLLVALQSCL